jgi:hypothetical protein
MGQLHIHQMGGAMGRVPQGATAFGSRDVPFLINYIALWLDEGEDGKNIAWCKDASDAMARFGTGRRYVNFLADEGEAGVESAYEPRRSRGFRVSRRSTTRRTSSTSTRTSSRPRRRLAGACCSAPARFGG